MCRTLALIVVVSLSDAGTQLVAGGTGVAARVWRALAQLAALLAVCVWP